MSYLLAGLAGGFISGMGIGGGTLLIPLLVIFLHMGQKEAQLMNLVFFIPTAVIALIVHFKEKNVKVKAGLRIIPYGILGALLGAFFMTRISESWMQKLFAFLVFALGILEIRKTFRKK